MFISCKHSTDANASLGYLCRWLTAGPILSVLLFASVNQLTSFPNSFLFIVFCSAWIHVSYTIVAVVMNRAGEWNTVPIKEKREIKVGATVALPHFKSTAPNVLSSIWFIRAAKHSSPGAYNSELMAAFKFTRRVVFKDHYLIGFFSWRELRTWSTSKRVTKLFLLFFQDRHLSTLFFKRYSMSFMRTLGGCLEQVRTFYLSQDKDFLSKQQQVYGNKHFNFSTSVNFSCQLYVPMWFVTMGSTTFLQKNCETNCRGF